MQFNKPLPIAILFVLILAACTDASATNLEKQINNDYRGKVLTLRQFCAGERLHFGPDGRLVGNLRTTAWTTDSQLEVEDLKLRGDVLELKGRRVRLIFDPSTKQLRDVTTILPNDEVGKRFRNPRNRKSWEQFLKSASVEIDLDLAATPHQESDLAAALDKVFVSSNDSVVDLVPAFWKHFLSRKDTNSSHPMPANDVYKVGGKVTPPHALSTPDPQYSELARQAGYSGTLMLSIVVTPEGHVHDLSIVTPLGLGLDEKAVEAVSSWTFNPAHKDGAPVAGQISVEVNFHLY
jgi:TonB family protein